MADRIKLETGTDALLQEDGTSFLLLEQQSFTINAIRNRQAVKRASLWGIVLMWTLMQS